MDSNGKERWRLEGYLSKQEFWINLDMGLARVDFMNKHWADAEKRYTTILERHPDSKFAPEALYYQGVCHYKAVNDHTALTKTAEIFTKKYQDSVWAMKSVPWLH
jgi:outer membrane protein assembly factor BamD (BamD/ComL family)